MPFLDSLPQNAGPPNLFKRDPDVYAPFSAMSEALMNGPSPLSPAAREIILALAAGAMGCDFVKIGHSAVAEAHGVAPGVIDALLAEVETAPVDPALKPVFAYAKTLAADPAAVTREDLDAILDAGWPDQAIHHAAAIVGRAAFMHRLIAGHGLGPLDPALAASHAAKRVEKGYVNLYPAFRKEG